jgi:hypothetical protein
LELIAENPLIRTQIDRIQSSIHRLVDFSNLESIKPYFFTPWDTIPYSVSISQLSKEKEAENHKNSAILLAPNQYYLYIDGLELENQVGIGIGLALFNSN